MPSSGGYGDPLDRDPALVLSDVLDGFTTIELAEHDFGVVIDSDAMQIDQEATGASAQRATAGSCRGRLRVSNRMRTRWLATDVPRQARMQGAFISILDMGATEDEAWRRAAPPDNLDPHSVRHSKTLMHPQAVIWNPLDDAETPDLGIAW